MKFRLQTQFAITIIAIILFLVLLLAGLLQIDFVQTIKESRELGSKLTRDALFDQTRKKGLSLAGLLSGSLVNALYFDNQDLINELARSTQGQPGVAYVFIYDRTNRVIQDGTVTIEKFGTLLNDKHLQESVKKRQPVSWTTDKVLHVTTPVLAGSRVLGGVRIGLKLDEIKIDQKNLQDVLARIANDHDTRFAIFTGVSALILIILGIIFAVIAAKRFTRPVNALMDLTDQYSKGNYDADISLNRTDEIGDLAIALKNMATARKLADAESRQHQEQLAHVSRVATMGEMATGIAHELNQPLAAIAAYIDGSLRRLSTENQTPKPIIEALEKASDQAIRAGDVIHRLRDFVRREDHKSEKVEISDTINTAMQLLKADFDLNKVDLSLDLARPSPVVIGDSVLIQQVIFNLVRNSVDAMSSMDSGSGKLIIKTSTDTDSILIKILDNGPGVEPELQKQLFEPYISTKKSGLGLGLPICRSIINELNGQIWYEPPPSQGAAFYIRLPLFSGESAV
tara:strand:- start:5357 stop:6895 length:1539 start_codon:yes stop_codon:yes gene_type:complete